MQRTKDPRASSEQRVFEWELFCTVFGSTTMDLASKLCISQLMCCLKNPPSNVLIVSIQCLFKDLETTLTVDIFNSFLGSLTILNSAAAAAKPAARKAGGAADRL